MAIASAKLNGYDSTAKYQSVFLEFWQISQSIENNQTTFGYKAYMQSNVSGASGYTGYGHYEFTGANPIAKVSNQTWSWTYATAQLIKEGTFTKTHAADGTLASQTLTVTAGGSTALGYATVSISLPVATIPRATQPTVNYSSRDMGLAISIGVSGVATFTHKLYYTFTGIAKTLITTVAAGVTSYAWTIPLSTLAPKIPNSTSGTVTITAETLSGSTVIGSKTVTFTATVPDTVAPSISSKTATEAVSGLAAQFGAFVQGKSKLNLAMAATASYGATISSHSITGNGQTFSAASGTTGFLSTAGTNTITYRATDSRGRSTSATLNVTVLAYAPPQVHTFRVERANASGVVDPTGDRVKATYKITVASLGSKNAIAYTLKYKRTDVATWTSVVLPATSYVPDTSYTVTSILTSYSYDFSLFADDYFESTTISGKVSSGFVPMHFRAGGKGVGIGMRATKDALELGLPFYANNHLQPLAYAREVTFSTAYVYAFSCSGDRLSSAVRFSVRGTSADVVIVAAVEIIANHSNSILISGTQGNYTSVTVKAISDGNGAFDVFLKHSMASTTPCLIEVTPIGGSVVSFTPLNTSAATKELTLAQNGYSTTGVNGGGGGDFLPLSGGTLTGPLTLPGSVVLAKDPSYNALRISNPNGYLQVGPLNTGTCHLYTDRPSFYFNKSLIVNGTAVSMDGHTHTAAQLPNAYTLLWSGTLSAVNGTATLNSAYTNFDMLLIYAPMYSDPGNAATQLIPTGQIILNKTHQFTAGVTLTTSYMMYINYMFTSSTVLKITATGGPSTESIRAIYGIKLV